MIVVAILPIGRYLRRGYRYYFPVTKRRRIGNLAFKKSGQHYRSRLVLREHGGFTKDIPPPLTHKHNSVGENMLS